MCCLIFHTFWTLSSVIMDHAWTICLYHSVTVFLRHPLRCICRSSFPLLFRIPLNGPKCVFPFQSQQARQPLSCGTERLCLFLPHAARVPASLQAMGLMTHRRGTKKRQCLRRVPSAHPPEVQIGHHGTASPTTESVW